MAIQAGMLIGADEQVHRIGLDDELGGEEAEVEDDRGGEHQHRAVEAELPAALDHLRNAEPRPLYRVEADQDKTDDDPEDDRDARPEKVQAHEHHHAAEDDGKDVRVQAEPHGELVTDPAVAFLGRDVIDRADLDQGAALRALPRLVCHRQLSPFPWWRSESHSITSGSPPSVPPAGYRRTRWPVRLR